MKTMIKETFVFLFILVLTFTISACSHLFSHQEQGIEQPAPVPALRENQTQSPPSFSENKQAAQPAMPTKGPRGTLSPVQPSTLQIEESRNSVTSKSDGGPKPAFSPPSPTVMEVIWASVNLREGPGTNYKIVGGAKKGTSVRILEDKGSWIRVRLDERKEGWMIKSATSEPPKTPSPSEAKTSPSTPPTPQKAPPKPISPM